MYWNSESKIKPFEKSLNCANCACVNFTALAAQKSPLGEGREEGGKREDAILFEWIAKIKDEASPC